jgi:hypothetical protein
MAVMDTERSPSSDRPQAEPVGRYQCTYDNSFTKQDWLDYYSRKRIIQQWTQVHLLGTVDCKKILEVGPALGLVTGMLVNIGYEVHTLDRSERRFGYPDVPHHQRDICELQPDEITGYDAILCCETLEHVEWDSVGSVLSMFRDSGAKYLIVSVPYMAFQVFLEIYLNRRTFRHYFSMKKLLWRKNFTAEPAGGHQWEVGYKGLPLRIWESRLRDGGWLIVKREFTEHCRSVFHLLRAN